MLTPLTDDDPVAIGPYRLQNRIGEGGMGTVYLAFTERREPVAVKLASAELAEDVEFRRRFQREVRAAQRVRGGAVAEVLDADTDARRPWMVTEYVEGISLADAVRQRGPLTERLVRGLAVGLADALVAIHEAGVVHRDLKPSNILLAWDGPRVMDFGIAQLDGNATLTRTGHVVGTLAWMAPEQMRGEQAGPPADVFSWGCCVAYAATGRHPFHAARAEVLAFRIQREAPDLDHLPDYLLGTVVPALAKEAGLRPSAAALLANLSGHPVRSVSEARRATETVLGRDWTGQLPGRSVRGPATDGQPRPRQDAVLPAPAGPPTGPAPATWQPGRAPVPEASRTLSAGPAATPETYPRPGPRADQNADWRSAQAGSMGAPPPADAYRPLPPSSGSYRPALPPSGGYPPPPPDDYRPVPRPPDGRRATLPPPDGRRATLQPPGGYPPGVPPAKYAPGLPPSGGYLPAPPPGDGQRPMSPQAAGRRAASPPADGYRVGPPGSDGYRPPSPPPDGYRPALPAADGYRPPTAGSQRPAPSEPYWPPPYSPPPHSAPASAAVPPAPRHAGPPVAAVARPGGSADELAGGGRSVPGSGTGWNLSAVLSAVLALCWLFGVGSAVGVYLGYRGRAAAKVVPRRGDGLAAVGIVLGWPGLLLAVIFLGVAAGRG
jgi:serine/threonine protein kinase